MSPAAQVETGSRSTDYPAEMRSAFVLRDALRPRLSMLPV